MRIKWALYFCLFISNSAQAWTVEECSIISSNALHVANEAKNSKRIELSPEFKKSLLGYLVVDGQVTCSGPKKIYVYTSGDRGAALYLDELLRKKGIRLANDVEIVVSPLRKDPKKNP